MPSREKTEQSWSLICWARSPSVPCSSNSDSKGYCRHQESPCVQPFVHIATTPSLHFTPAAGAAISWRSKQQHEVASSSSEAEFRACNLCGREELFLRKLLAEFSDRTPDCGSNVMPPTTIYSDNKTCVMIKWLRNKCHPVWTEHQASDVMSKPLAKEKHWKHTTPPLHFTPDPPPPPVFLDGSRGPPPKQPEHTHSSPFGLAANPMWRHVWGAFPPPAIA